MGGQGEQGGEIVSISSSLCVPLARCRKKSGLEKLLYFFYYFNIPKSLMVGRYSTFYQRCSMPCMPSGIETLLLLTHYINFSNLPPMKEGNAVDIKLLNNQ